MAELKPCPLCGGEAEFHASYISGALDMANAIMKAIEDLGGTR